MNTKRKSLKVIGYILAGLLVLLLIAYLALQTSTVQNYISSKLLDSIADRYGNKISIKHIEVDFFDRLTAKDLLITDLNNKNLLKAEELIIDIGLLSFFNKKIVIDQFILKKANVYIQENIDSTYNFDFLISGSEGDLQSQDENLWDFQVKYGAFNEIELMYDGLTQNYKILQETLSLSFDMFDLESKEFFLNQGVIKNGNIEVTLTEEKDKEGNPFTLPDSAFKIVMGKLKVENQHISVISGNDTIKINHEDLMISKLQYEENSINGALSSMKFTTENKPVNISASSFQLDSNLLSIEDLSVISDKDNVQSDVSITINQSMSYLAENLSLNISSETLEKYKTYLPKEIHILKNSDLILNADKLTYNGTLIDGNNIILNYGKDIDISGNVKINDFTNPSRSHYDLNVNKAFINFKTLERILPSFSKPSLLNDFQSASIKGYFRGTADSLSMKDVLLKSSANSIRLNGKINNLNNLSNLWYDLDIIELFADINSLHLDSVDGVNIDSLGITNYTGKVIGNNQQIRLDGKLISDLGKAELSTDFIFPTEKSTFKYDGLFKFKDFDLGTLLNNKDLGSISISTNLKGAGTEISDISSNINGNIESFTYQGYTYKNITIDGEFSDCIASGAISIDDPNIRLSYQGETDLSTDEIKIEGYLSIDTLNMSELPLGYNDFGIKGDIECSLHLPLKPNQKNEINITNLWLNNDSIFYHEDKIRATLNKKGKRISTSVNSNFMKANLEGNYRVSELPFLLKRIVAQFSAQGLSDSLSAIKYESENLNYNVLLRNAEPINVIFPEDDIFLGRGLVQGNVDFAREKYFARFGTDTIVFNGTYIENLSFQGSNIGDKLTFSLNAKNMSPNGIGLFSNTTLESTLEKGILKSDLLVSGKDGTQKLGLGFEILEIDSALFLSFNDSLVLNNEDWFFSKGNKVLVGSEKLTIKDLSIYDADEKMDLYSIDKGIDVDFSNFNLGHIISLWSENPQEVDGRLNGKVELRDLYQDFYFLVNVKVEEIKYENKPVGSILLTADEKQTTGIISGTFDLIGSENDVLGSGTYDPKTRKIDWDIFIGLMEMRLLDPFLEELISDSKGIMYGEIAIGGNPDQIDIQGSMEFEDIATTIDINNSRYNFPYHKIEFDNNTIDIGSILIKDKNGNTATITGEVNHRFYRDLNLDLDIDTDKFIFLNTNSINNPIFYGTVILDGNISIDGPLELLNVEVNATALDSSALTLSPFSETESILKEEFLRYGKPEDFEGESVEYLQKVARLYPFDVNINLEVDNSSQFTFVVDPLSGDKLVTRGNGNLRVNLQPNGEQLIYGNYAIQSGKYSFSYGGVVNRNFSINEGGNIRFNGNPLNATMDIDAVYTLNTTVYELIKNEVSLDDNEAEAAKRRTEVKVLLSLTGNLLEPEISLDVQIPDYQAGALISTVDRKLNELRNDPNELNNQVFGLLVFNSFLISENATSGFENVGESIALSSISNLISAQLNRLAENVITGLDVTIDVNSYNSQYVNNGSGGTVTEVGLNVSKQLFNDRISISAGTNFNLNDMSSQEGAFTNFLGDFVIEYKLTEAGNYRLRVFSRTNYDRLLNQNTARNGVSLFFTKDYDSKIKDEKK